MGICTAAHTVPMKTLFAALALITLIATPVFADDPPAPASKEAKARELLVLLRSGDTAVQAIESMIASLREASPEVPEKYWANFKKEVKPDEFIDLLVPVYANNLDEAELDGLITFFKSPIGQRYIEKQSVILQQSMEAGEKWGETVATRAMQELQEKE